MYPEQWLQRFTQIVGRPEDEINLAEAALIIAADEYPDLDVARYLARLTKWRNRRARASIPKCHRAKELSR